MECSCEIDIDASDSFPAVFEAKIVKSRKMHKCGECNRKIWKGEKYEIAKGLWDGEWRSYKTCNDCLSVRDEFFTYYFFGELWNYFYEYIDDCGGDIPEKCLANLTPKSRSKVLMMLQKYQEDD